MDNRQYQQAVGQRHMRQQPGLQRQLQRVVEIEIVLFFCKFEQLVRILALFGIEVPAKSTEIAADGDRGVV